MRTSSTDSDPGGRVARLDARFAFPVLVLLLCSFARLASAQTCLTAAEQKKVKEVIQLMRFAFSDTERGKSLKTTFGQTGGSQVGYDQTGGKDTTLGQALDALTDMVEKRIKKENISGRGYTDARSGTGSDVIVFNDDYIDILLGGGTVRQKMDAKFQLMATLANEMTHVYQRFDATDARQCDAERDSDCATILVLCKMLDAMTDATGAAHMSFAAMLGDPEYFPGLISCIADLGGTGADIPDLVEDLKKKKKSYEDRKANIFVAHIAAGTSWGRDYYGAGWTGPFRFPRDLATHLELTAGNGLTVQNYAPGPFSTVDQWAIYADDSGQLRLVIAGAQANGSVQLFWWQDVDDDELPEAGVAVPPLQIAPPGASRAPDSVFLRHYAANAPQGILPTPHLLVHDTVQGTLTLVPLGPSGLPGGPPILVAQEPAIAAPTGGGGASIFAHENTTPAPGLVRLAFSATPPVMHFGHVPTVWIDVPVGGGPAVTNTGQTMAQALAPGNALGIEVLEVGEGADLHLTGNPGEALTLSSAGRGTVATLAAGTAGSGGRTAGLFASGSIEANDLFLVDGSGRQARVFLPRVGTTTDLVDVFDDTGDGVGDSIAISSSPSRLHLLAGLVSAPSSAARDVLYELVLEQETPFVRDWDVITGRVLGSVAGDVLLQPILGSSPPLYAQSLHAIAPGPADDALVVYAVPGAANYTVEAWHDVLGVPQLLQSFSVPLLGPADHLAVLPRNDGLVDYCLTDASGAGVLFVNNGSGILSLVPSLYPGTGDDLTLSVTILGGPIACTSIVEVAAGDIVDVFIESPGGTFDLVPLIGVGQIFATGFPPIGPTLFPELHINLNAVPGPFIFLGGNLPSPIGTGPIVLPGGSHHYFLAPPAAPGVSVMSQVIVLSNQAANGILAITAGVEIRYP